MANALAHLRRKATEEKRAPVRPVEARDAGSDTFPYPDTGTSPTPPAGAVPPPPYSEELLVHIWKGWGWFILKKYPVPAGREQDFAAAYKAICDNWGYVYRPVALLETRE